MSMMILLVLATGTVSIAQDMPSEYQQVLTFLENKATTRRVLKVNIRGTM